MKKETFLARLGAAESFPLELTLASGERHVALHPAYAYIHPASGRVCLFSERRTCDVALDPDEVVRLRRLRKGPVRDAAPACDRPPDGLISGSEAAR
jgi:hypothetical protein